jgi:TM2 domain-containing membrane protein YozV
MSDIEITPEVPEPGFEETEAAFEESLGSNFGRASIIEEEQQNFDEQTEQEQRTRSVFTSMRQISIRDHRVAGVLAMALGAFGMHKFYMGYHDQGFILLIASILLGLVSFGLGILAIWMVAFSEGMTYFTLSQQEFERTYVEGTHNWF